MEIKCAHDELVIIYKGHELLIDLKDLPLLAKYQWHIVKKHKVSYLVRNGDTGSIYFHREKIGSISMKYEVDHINGNGLDNRDTNLRLVTHQINQNNQINRSKEKTTSKYLYVHWRSDRNKWCTMISYENKTKNIGLFKTEQLAALAANDYIIKNNMQKVLNNI